MLPSFHVAFDSKDLDATENFLARNYAKRSTGVPTAVNTVAYRRGFTHVVSPRCTDRRTDRLHRPHRGAGR